MTGISNGIYRIFFKRIIDFIVSLIVFIIVSPLTTAILMILLFVNKGHPFFFQARPGKNGKIFKVIKFKTMNDEKDKHGKLLPAVNRITKVGGFIRKHSLDELPQLISVLKGEMSLVGPRPLLIEYLPFYSKEQARRHEVFPGITGWAQVNGRNTISWEERFKLDVFYVDHVSFMFDFKIILLTIWKVLKKEGIDFDASQKRDFTG